MTNVLARRLSCLFASNLLIAIATPAFAEDVVAFREIESKHLFGFTTGTDIGLEGEKEIAVETTGRFLKRRGRFEAFEHRLEFETTPTQFLQLEMSLLGATHRITGVPEIDNVSRSVFEGISGEIRYLAIGRGPSSPFGLTLSFEPTVAHIDDTTGERLRRVETELKASLDTELVPNRVFLAFNALYEPEWVHPRFAPTEKEASIGLSSALAVRLTPELAIGGELRYLRKYEGIDLKHYEGDAVYLGPNLHLQLSKKVFLSGALLAQATGHEAVDRKERATAVFEAIGAGEDPLGAVAPRHGFNLKDFDRYRARLHIGVEF